MKKQSLHEGRRSGEGLVTTALRRVILQRPHGGAAAASALTERKKKKERRRNWEEAHRQVWIKSEDAGGGRFN